jgi:hypothetical protein
MSTQNQQAKRSVGRPRLIQRVDPLPKLGILNVPSNDDNLVELSYDNVSIFKKIFNLLKTMNVKEINIQFNTNYTKIYGIDHLEKNLINIKIDSNKLNHYYCESPINITLDPKNLDKITQKIDKHYSLFSIILKKKTYRNNIIIILNNKILSIDESHIINLIETNVDYNSFDSNKLDYNLYGVKFELTGKYFKKLINDVSTFSEIFTIELINNGFLQFIYKNINNTIKGYNICKNSDKIKLQTNLSDTEIFSVSVRIDYIKALSNSLLAEKIKIFADSDNDLVFSLLIDNGCFEVIINTSINKFT